MEDDLVEHLDDCEVEEVYFVECKHFDLLSLNEDPVYDLDKEQVLLDIQVFPLVATSF